jgi:O-acetyl-ADP-ribose deacetylase (regulator of RNase III)/uncharacterized protein YwgA
MKSTSGTSQIEVKVGDLFQSDAQTFVNTVNCVGVMGKGIALEFKKRFPDMFDDYVERCNRKMVRLGKPYLYCNPSPPHVLNFPTKDHWRSVSRLSDVVAGLEYLERHYKDWGIESLVVPPLGCGNGGLEWRVVGPTLYRHLARLNIPVVLYAPIGTPEDELAADFLDQPDLFSERPKNTDDRLRVPVAAVALASILHRVEREPYHWSVGRTTFQKIAYFATCSGISTGLEFVRGSYGPFSAELKSLITRMVNNGLLIEQAVGGMMEVRVGPSYIDARRVFQEDITKWNSSIERVADLFLRTDTRRAEVAASVHFVAKELLDSENKYRRDEITELAVLQAVKDWKIRRRPPLSDEEIAITVRHLNLLRWISVKLDTSLPLPDSCADQDDFPSSVVELDASNATGRSMLRNGTLALPL